jgi:isopentenyl-diphosphate delta-isomerase
MQPRTTTTAGRSASEELIVLVDHDGNEIGSAGKDASHHSETPLHLAFSCYVFDDAGRFLTTRRARPKKVWPGVWSNTVCGHPAPGERMLDAVGRRMHYELGMQVRDLKVALPDHMYRAPAFNGVVEYELCPVFVARASTEPCPNPTEVEAYEWVDWPSFVRRVQSDTADVYSWWCKNQLRQLASHALIGDYASGLADRASPPPA